MFERYTEGARRVIFFARYEASQYGCEHIEAEHILLGLFRQDKELVRSYCKDLSVDDVRRLVDVHAPTRPPTSTSIDLPLSDPSKRVLAYAAEEAERLAHKNIATKHLLLGLLREEKSHAAEILRGCGLRLDALREEVARPKVGPPIPTSPLRDVSQVSLNSDPPNAEIEVDGKFIGTTPAEVLLPIGERLIRITRDGCEVWERTLLMLPASRQSVFAELTKSK